MVNQKDRTLREEDVINILDREINCFDYRNIGILDELYKIRDEICTLPDAMELKTKV